MLKAWLKFQINFSRNSFSKSTKIPSIQHYVSYAIIKTRCSITSKFTNQCSNDLFSHRKLVLFIVLQVQILDFGKGNKGRLEALPM